MSEYFNDIITRFDKMEALADELNSGLDRLKAKFEYLSDRAEKEYIELINHQEYLNSFKKK